eukprot:TRINITY_DN76300_c0_g2_i1.p1 TRINITY_DN76300_c0_g2~~TRINITY_DN76300_c0_g2_i1.p1  ORF type:complete len:460 (-),score=76.50 TRINITY_DN76300_c0_g2_i1:1304-2683(-)
MPPKRRRAGSVENPPKKKPKGQKQHRKSVPYETSKGIAEEKPVKNVRGKDAPVPPPPMIHNPHNISALEATRYRRTQQYSEGHTRAILSIALHPDQTQLLAASHDMSTSLWDLRTGIMSRRYHGHSQAVLHCCFSATGEYFATASADKTCRIYETDIRESQVTVFGHEDRVNCCSFSPCDTYLLTCSKDNSIILHDFEKLIKGQNALVFKMQGHPANAEGHRGSVQQCRFSPNSKFIISCSEDSTCKLFDVRTGQLIRSFLGHQDHVLSLCFSPCGTKFASCGNDHTVRIWDARSGRTIRVLKGHEDVVYRCEYSPEGRGRRIISGSHDKSILIWNAATGGKIFRIENAHIGWILGLAWSMDGLTFYSCSSDHIMGIWKAQKPGGVAEVCCDRIIPFWLKKAARRFGAALCSACRGAVLVVPDRSVAVSDREKLVRAAKGKQPSTGTRKGSTIRHEFSY